MLKRILTVQFFFHPTLRCSPDCFQAELCQNSHLSRTFDGFLPLKTPFLCGWLHRETRAQRSWQQVAAAELILSQVQGDVVYRFFIPQNV